MGRIKKPLIGTKFYFVWAQLKQRCKNPQLKNYKNYGGRGITYTPRWETFNFFMDDMYPSYREGLSIDRIDVNGHYEPDNCRWATPSEQNLNKRKKEYVNYIVKPLC